MRLRSHAAPTWRGTRAEPLEADGRPLIGSLLVGAGELNEVELNRVIEHQARTGMLFGEAAVDLGFVSLDALGRAVSEQHEVSLLDPATSPVSRAVVAAYDPLDPLTQKLRALRSTLFGPEELKGSTTKIIVIAGVTGNDTPGLAANLAVVVAQLGLETLLVDCNFAAPTLHKLFALPNRSGTTTLLLQNDRTELPVAATPVPHLELLPSGPDIPNSAELVERVSICAALRQQRHGHRAIIVDAGTQALEVVTAIARGSDGVLIIAERRRTPMQGIGRLIARLKDSDVDVLGTVLAR
jgi:Mrp family chromosome partitioning ATPase